MIKFKALLLRILLLVLIFIENLTKIIENCSTTNNSSYIQCSFNDFKSIYLNNATNNNTSLLINNVEILIVNCRSFSIDLKNAKLFGLKLSTFPNLRRLSIHNCGANILQSLPKLVQKLDLLNLTHNNLFLTEWKIFSQIYVRILDLRNNSINCINRNCENYWLYMSQQRLFHTNPFVLNYNWDIYTIFPQLPKVIYMDNDYWNECANFSIEKSCLKESATMEFSSSLKYDQPLNLMCHFK